jgi:predicted O-methyltransferase YrrM
LQPKTKESNRYPRKMARPGATALHFLRYLVGLDRAHTQTTPREQETLAEYARGKRRLVEIGVYEGATTRCLAEVMSNEGELFAIDPFIVGRFGICWGKVIARREVAAIANSRRVHFIEEYSHQAVSRVEGQLDFVFIDGDHALGAIQRDWSDWSPKTSIGGVIALHDTRVPAHNPNVAMLGSYQFFEQHIRHDPRFELLEQIDSLSILRRL